MSKVVAAEVERSDRPSQIVGEPALDVAHLGRMTFGERGLESEVLRLFDRQASMLLARMKDRPPTELAAFAHTLKGSARGIGAWPVAKAAEALELTASSCNELDISRASARLAAAVKAARAAIGDRLRAGELKRRS